MAATSILAESVGKFAPIEICNAVSPPNLILLRVLSVFLGDLRTSRSKTVAVLDVGSAVWELGTNPISLNGADSEAALQFELRRNPWKLVNIIDWNGAGAKE
jgi:hypothetical protein